MCKSSYKLFNVFLSIGCCLLIYVLEEKDMEVVQKNREADETAPQGN